jgi:DNA-binding MarR family transcriptional regulator
MKDSRLDTIVDQLERTTALWREFLGVHRLLIEQLAEQMAAEHLLPLEWFDVLIHLARVPSMRLRQAVLRDRLLLSESGVSRMLARMGKAGLIARTPADDDKRGVEIALTERGQEALLAATESHLELVAHLFSDRLDAADREALWRILSKLIPQKSVSTGDCAQSVAKPAATDRAHHY